MFELIRKSFRLPWNTIDFSERLIFSTIGRELMLNGFKLKYYHGNAFDGRRTRRICAKHEFATLKLYVDLIPYSENYLYVGLFSSSTAIAELQQKNKTSIHFCTEISEVVSRRLIELGMEEIEL